MAIVIPCTKYSFCNNCFFMAHLPYKEPVILVWWSVLIDVDDKLPSERDVILREMEEVMVVVMCFFLFILCSFFGAIGLLLLLWEI